jgi:agmatinase
VPFDTAAGFRPGQRFAPQAVRDASLRYTLPPEGLYDLRRDRVRLAGLTVRDVGDVDLPSLEPELGRERITSRARALRQRAALPVFIGGDHSVTFPLLRAFDDIEQLQIVQLDAHLDFGDVRNATRFSNSSPFRRAVEEIPSIASVTTIGLRGPRFDREAVVAAKARGHRLVPMWELGDGLATTTARLEAAVAHLQPGAPVYLSIDVDVLDPSVLPGTSSPEPDGLAYAAVEYLIGAWSISAEDPATHETVAADYRVEQLPGSPWLSGQGVSADRSINARDIWGRDPLTGEIVRVVFDASGAWATVRAKGWTGDTLALEGEVRSGGGTVRVRETITRLGPDRFRAVWEAFRDGRWQAYSIETVTRRT